MPNTELLAAIQQCNPAQAAAAITRGVQPDAHDARGYTPFPVALLTADAATARALLGRGVEATLDDTHWWMKGVEDAADLASRQGWPWKAAG
jgi:ankyrin repeat protein